MSAAPQVVLFHGSLDWTDRDRIRRDLEGLPPDSVVIASDERGAARIAREEAKALGLHVATVATLWDFYDKPAGYRRNEAMARFRPDFLFVYPLGESPGTRHMIRTAEGECIQVREP
jgi:hypothetical protein